MTTLPIEYSYGPEFGRDKEAYYKHVDTTVADETKRRIDDMVPYGWRPVVCCCYSGWGARDRNDDGSFRPCDRCGKARRFLFAYCLNCREYYCTVFSHSEKNTAFPPEGYDGPVVHRIRPSRNPSGACWVCIVSRHGIGPEDVPPPDWATPPPIRTLAELLADDTGNSTELDFDF